MKDDYTRGRVFNEKAVMNIAPEPPARLCLASNSMELNLCSAVTPYARKSCKQKNNEKLFRVVKTLVSPAKARKIFP